MAEVPEHEGAGVVAEVIDNIKADKVITFVKRRRKHSSKRTRGHRQQLTLLRVTDILETGADKSDIKAATGARAARRAYAAEAVCRSQPAQARAQLAGILAQMQLALPEGGAVPREVQGIRKACLAGIARR